METVPGGKGKVVSKVLGRLKYTFRLLPEA